MKKKTVSIGCSLWCWFQRICRELIRPWSVKVWFNVRWDCIQNYIYITHYKNYTCYSPKRPCLDNLRVFNFKVLLKTITMIYDTALIYDQFVCYYSLIIIVKFAINLCHLGPFGISILWFAIRERRWLSLTTKAKWNLQQCIPVYKKIVVTKRHVNCNNEHVVIME